MDKGVVVKFCSLEVADGGLITFTIGVNSPEERPDISSRPDIVRGLEIFVLTLPNCSDVLVTEDIAMSVT